MRERLLLSPWIRETIIRKELPHTVVIKIREAEPLALLKRKKSL
jgi:cell division septal protein FtsQ